MKRWPLHTAYFWETAPFFRVVLPFAGGIVGYELTRSYFNALISSAVFIVVAFIAYLIVAYTRKQKGYFPALGFLLMSGIFFAGGYALSSYDDVRNDTNHFAKGSNYGEAYLVRITETPAERERTWKIPVSILSVIDSGGAQALTGKAFIYVYKSDYPLRLHKGDSLIVPGNWQPIKTPGNPFEFDYARYCRRNGILLQQFCSRAEIKVYGVNNPASNSLTERIHRWCMAVLDTYITDKKARGLIQAMLLGDEVNLDEELRDAYAETGIIHIIAISGGNVAIFFVVISFLLRWLRHNKYLWIKYLVALPLVWFYVVMAGSSPSAIRAAVMFSLLALGIMMQKNNNSLNQLFATAFVLLCAEPMWLFAVGFQLSFVAVLSIILFYGPIYGWLSPKYKITTLLWGTVAASLAAEILIAPIVIYYFHNFPAMFLVANVTAYVFMSLVLVLGIGVVVLSIIPTVASVLGVCITWLVDVFGDIVSWLQHFNPKSFHFLVLTDVELVLTYIVVAGFGVFFLHKQKKVLFIGLGVSVLLMVSLCYNQWLALSQQRLVVYNISGLNRIEWINSNCYSVISPDTGSTKKIQYAIMAAHTNWLAWRKGNDTGEVFVISGKTVLVANDEIHNRVSFRADYVIINHSGNVEPEEMKLVFPGAAIVVGNNFSPKQREQIRMKCEKAGIACHVVGDNGAFVLN